MKTWLVTGGAGFIGTNFVLGAVRQGLARVVTLDALTYAGNRANLDGLDGHPNHVFVHGNIQDRPLVDTLLERHRPDAVVHFAAESHVDRSIEQPDAFIQTNVLGTLCLLNAVRSYLAKDRNRKLRFLHVSTDEVYGSLGPTGFFHEQSRVSPNSPYAASKAASDHLVRAYHHTYGLDAVTTNTCNNYGPYQFPEKLLPLMILNALEAKPLPVYGDGQQRRDWIFVEDHCAGVALALERGQAGETYVLGSRAESTNLDMVHLLCDLIEEVKPAAQNPQMAQAGKRSYRELVTFVDDRPGHDRRYAIDPTRAERELGFSPRYTLREGLGQTVRWYVENGAWCKTLGYGRQRRGLLAEEEAQEARR